MMTEQRGHNEATSAHLAKSRPISGEERTSLPPPTWLPQGRPPSPCRYHGALWEVKWETGPSSPKGAAQVFLAVLLTLPLEF